MVHYLEASPTTAWDIGGSTVFLVTDRDRGRDATVSRPQRVMARNGADLPRRVGLVGYATIGILKSNPVEGENHDSSGQGRRIVS